MSDISQQLIDAQQALVNKDLDAANRIIVDLTTTHPDDPNVRYLACLLLRLQGRNDEAMQSLQSLTSDVPDHARAFQFGDLRGSRTGSASGSRDQHSFARLRIANS